MAKKVVLVKRRTVAGKAGVGSKRQVFEGTASKTSGGLTKSDLMRNKRGKIVSKKAHANGLRMAGNLVPVGGGGRRGGSILADIVPFGHELGLGLSSYASSGGRARRAPVRRRVPVTRRGGNIFSDIMDGIGKVVDVGAKVLPAVITHFA